jgi:hypothetical protein
MAVLWDQIENTKDIFPYLEYKAVIDSKTSEICKPLDGVILKVDDPFWSKYSPLNHFNCRCTIKKLDKYTDKLTTNPDRMAEITKELNVPKEFQMNSGKDGYIFNPKEHPYFKVAPKDKANAGVNFGLPIPPPPPPKVATPPKQTPAATPKTSPVPKEAPKKAPKESAKENNYNFEKMGDKERQEAVKQMFAKKGISVANVDMDALIDYKQVPFLNQLQKLMNEYKLPNGALGDIMVDFRSTAKTYGSVTHNYDFKEGAYKITKVNFGNKTDTFHRQYDWKEPDNRKKSRSDEDQKLVSTLTHEFAHMFSISERKNASPREREFWNKLDRINTEYKNELKAAKPEQFRKIHLGDYASTKPNEFMAEGFAEYKNCKKPTKYAKKIGELIDEYYKK